MDLKEKWLRKISEKLLPFFKKNNVPAEFLTLFRIFFGFLVFFIFIFGNRLFLLIFITLYQFALMLDYIDGKLAKAQNRFSIKWVKFEFYFHYVISFLFLLGVTIICFRESKGIFLLYLGLFGSLSIFISSLLALKNFEKIRIRKIGIYKGKFSGFYSFVSMENPFSLFYFLIIINFIKTAIILYSLLNIIILIRKLR